MCKNDAFLRCLFISIIFYKKRKLTERAQASGRLSTFGELPLVSYSSSSLFSIALISWAVFAGKNPAKKMISWPTTGTAKDRSRKAVNTHPGSSFPYASSTLLMSTKDPRITKTSTTMTIAIQNQKRSNTFSNLLKRANGHLIYSTYLQKSQCIVHWYR